MTEDLHCILDKTRAQTHEGAIHYDEFWAECVTTYPHECIIIPRMMFRVERGG